MRALLSLSMLITAGMASADSTFDALLADLRGGKEQDRVAALRTLETRDKDEAAVPPLAESLRQDPSPLVRALCAEVLGKWGANGAEAQLVAALTDPDPIVGDAAFRALERLDLPVRSEVITAIEAMRNHQSHEGYSMVRKFREMGVGERGVLDATIMALEASYPLTRRLAAWTLGEFGEPALVAVPALTKRLTDPSRNVRFSSAMALGYIGKYAPEEVVTPLCIAMRDKDWLVRNIAIHSLRELGPAAFGAVSDLTDALENDPHEIIRHSAGLALDDIAPAPDGPETLLQIDLPPGGSP